MWLLTVLFITYRSPPTVSYSQWATHKKCMEAAIQAEQLSQYKDEEGNIKRYGKVRFSCKKVR